MLALPIARRELLVLSRAAGTWQKRAVSSAGVLGFGMLLAMVYQYAGPMVFRQAMHVLGVGLSMMCLFAGVALTADAIAEEKREGTLGLLLLTNLSALEIVLGKLVAHGVVGFYLVLCALPLLSMSMIFGGMGLGDVVKYVASALNVLFFSAAVGLWASCVCRERRQANAVGTVVVMMLWMGLPMLALLVRFLGGPGWVVEVMGRLSVNLPMGVGVGFGRVLASTSEPWWNLAWPQMLGWALIGLAVWRLPRDGEDGHVVKRRGLRELWKGVSHGGAATRLKLRRRLLDRNAFMWLASRDRLQALGVWIISLSLLGFVGAHTLMGKLDVGLLIGMTVAISVVLQLALSGAAGTQVLREYEQGTLELVLSTALSVPAVIEGQLAAARRHYRGLFALTFVLFWAGIALLGAKGGPPRLLGITLVAVYSGLFVLNFYALGWVGMWCIVKAADPKKAHAVGFFLLTIFPGMMFGLMVSGAQFVSWLTGWRWSIPEVWLLPLLFVLAFSNCIYWLLRAKRELPHQLRLFAFRRYTAQERATFFGQVGKLAGRLFQRVGVGRKRTVLDSR